MRQKSRVKFHQAKFLITLTKTFLPVFLPGSKFRLTSEELRSTLSQEIDPRSQSESANIALILKLCSS